MSLMSLVEEERKALKLIEDAKAKAEKLVSDAKKKAEEILAQAVKRGVIEARVKEAEREANEEARRIRESYEKEASRIRSTPDELIEKASNLVLREVLKVE